MVRFYRDGLGLAVTDQFEGHAGYSGVIFELARDVELEITNHTHGRAPIEPDPDDLLVIYLPSAGRVARRRQRLERQGYVRVDPVNPWWSGRAVTFEDPDGWRVVLCDETTT